MELSRTSLSLTESVNLQKIDCEQAHPPLSAASPADAVPFLSWNQRWFRQFSEKVCGQPQEGAQGCARALARKEDI